MILVAATAFKSTHSAAAVTQSISRAVEACGQHAISRPVSDGGPGLLDAMRARDDQVHFVEVSGPLGDVVRARILLQPGRAVIESADACGVHLIKRNHLDPLRASTSGVGELLLQAAALSQHVVVGLGGSATMDAGVGMARALGFRILDAAGRHVSADARGLIDADRIQPAKTSLPRITALADVRNPLFGPNGAARIFGAQKGASPQQVEAIDRAAERLSQILRRDLGADVTGVEGSGAAGGLGAGMLAFAGAQLKPGSEWLLQELQFERLLQSASLVITGEGAYDAQSSMGKITGHIINLAAKLGIPVLLVAGRIEGQLPPHVHPATEHGPLSLADIERLVQNALTRLLSL